MGATGSTERATDFLLFFFLPATIALLFYMSACTSDLTSSSSTLSSSCSTAASSSTSADSSSFLATFCFFSLVAMGVSFSSVSPLSEVSSSFSSSPVVAYFLCFLTDDLGLATSFLGAGFSSASSSSSFFVSSVFSSSFFSAAGLALAGVSSFSSSVVSFASSSTTCFLTALCTFFDFFLCFFLDSCFGFSSADSSPVLALSASLSFFTISLFFFFFDCLALLGGAYSTSASGSFSFRLSSELGSSVTSVGLSVSSLAPAPFVSASASFAG